MAYPHGRFRYKVEIDGLKAGGFSEVTGFDAPVDVMEYREGDMVQTPMKIPGLKKYGNITLKQGPGGFCGVLRVDCGGRQRGGSEKDHHHYAAG